MKEIIYASEDTGEKIKTYVAKDNTHFFSISDCITYEKNISSIEEMKGLVSHIPKITNIPFFTYITEAYYINNQQEATLVCKWFDTLNFLSKSKTCSLCNFSISDYYVFIINPFEKSDENSFGNNTLNYLLIPLSVVFDNWQKTMDATLPNLPQDYIDSIPKSVKDFYDILMGRNDYDSNYVSSHNYEEMMRKFDVSVEETLKLLESYKNETAENKEKMIEKLNKDIINSIENANENINENADKNTDKNADDDKIPNIPLSDMAIGKIIMSKKDK